MGLDLDHATTTFVCRECERRIALTKTLRKDQKCDNSRCRDAYRQRRYRAEQQKYEANRRRYRKKGTRAKELISLRASLRHSFRPQPDAEPFAVAFNDLSQKK